MIGTTTMRYAICVLAFFQSGIFLVVCTIELGAVFSFEVQDFWRVSKSRFTKSSVFYTVVRSLATIIRNCSVYNHFNK